MRQLRKRAVDRVCLPDMHCWVSTAQEPLRAGLAAQALLLLVCLPACELADHVTVSVMHKNYHICHI